MTDTAESIKIAFANDVKLQKRIFDAIDETPQHTSLFHEIAKYQLASQQFSIVNGKENGLDQPSKKRKLEKASRTAPQNDQPSTILCEARDISFTLPQRKKLHLNLIQHGSDFNAPTTTFTIYGRNPATSQTEFEYPLTAFAQAIRVPVPEKAQKQYNFCLLPPLSQNVPVENIIWTVNHGPLKSYKIFSEDLKRLLGQNEDLESTLDAVLKRIGTKLVFPQENEFVSALVESHRKNDKAYHVKAFRGSKDGYLFFLENGIFFGFKKPLAFFSFHEIESVSYTAVLQRTFNLIVVVGGTDTAEQQEIEFSMLDQADFAGIDTYIKKHQLQDASMAEARRAKQFKVNGAKGAAVEGEDNGEQSELQKAEQELEDEEDEMEEDYDPGSDGESEGSGSSDDDDDYTVNAKGRDIVKDELGSEAEDVEITDDEDEGKEEEEEEEEEEEKEIEAAQPKLIVKQPPIPSVSTAKAEVPDFDDEDQL